MSKITIDEVVRSLRENCEGDGYDSDNIPPAVVRDTARDFGGAIGDFLLAEAADDRPVSLADIRASLTTKFGYAAVDGGY